MKEQISIRSLEPGDIPAVYKLVRDLAIYEKAEEELVTTTEYYHETLLNGSWNAFVAEVKNEIVGTTIFYPIFSTWKGRILYLEDFVVRSNFRRMGIGKRLFDNLLSYAQENQFKGMRWQVLDWNESAISFYRSYHSKMEFDWVNCQLLL